MLLRILGLLVAVVAVVLGAVHAFCGRGVGQANAGQAGSRRRISCIRSVRGDRSVRGVRGNRSVGSVRGRGHAVRWRGVEHQPLATRPIIKAAESISNMSRGVKVHLGKLGE